MSRHEGGALDRGLVAPARRHGIGAEDASRLAGRLPLLGDPVRIRLLYSLDLVDELCVGDLALVLCATEDAVSYGLRLLRTAGLVDARSDRRGGFSSLAQR